MEGEEKKSSLVGFKGSVARDESRASVCEEAGEVTGLWGGMMMTFDFILKSDEFVPTPNLLGPTASSLLQ